jgi:hypothetical protein
VCHTPEQNGVTERQSRAIVDKVRAALNSANLDPSFWAEAALDAVDKLKQFTSRATGNLRQVEFYGKPASVATVLPFGQHGYVTDTQSGMQKIAPRARPARYMSIIGSTMYRVYYPDNPGYGTCRVADFRCYNPAKDPTVVAPSPVLALPPDLQPLKVMLASAADSSINEPLPGVKLPPLVRPAIAAYEVEVLRAPDDGRHADVSTAAYLAEQHSHLS